MTARVTHGATGRLGLGRRRAGSLSGGRVGAQAGGAGPSSCGGRSRRAAKLDVRAGTVDRRSVVLVVLAVLGHVRVQVAATAAASAPVTVRRLTRAPARRWARCCCPGTQPAALRGSGCQPATQ